MRDSSVAKVGGTIAVPTFHSAYHLANSVLLNVRHLKASSGRFASSACHPITPANFHDPLSSKECVATSGVTETEDFVVLSFGRDGLVSPEVNKISRSLSVPKPGKRRLTQSSSLVYPRAQQLPAYEIVML